MSNSIWNMSFVELKEEESKKKSEMTSNIIDAKAMRDRMNDEIVKQETILLLVNKILGEAIKQASFGYDYLEYSISKNESLYCQDVVQALRELGYNAHKSLVLRECGGTLDYLIVSWKSS